MLKHVSRDKSRVRAAMPIWGTIVGLSSLALLIATLLKGTDIALMNPKGQIASEQHRLMILAAIIMLEVLVPTLLLLYFTAWKYRESNSRDNHEPEDKQSRFLVFSIWATPCIFMLVLASIMWPATHRLAPQKAIESGVKPLRIQVVALRWKWLFIYPEQNIAAVNFAHIPTEVPVQFDITADETPMSSFWIPHLAGQLYAMTGHVNRLNVLAETSGDYNGSSAEINGAGFAGMKFTARAGSVDEFNKWVRDTQASTNELDTAAYKKLLVPSEYDKAAFYSAVQPGLYDTMLMKYMGSHNSHAGIE